MRRLEYLISEARQSTNTVDIASISMALCTLYMNRIHSYVEDLMFLVNDENDLFISDYLFNLVVGQDEYNLPPHIYAKSSIDNLAVSFLNGLSNTYLHLKKISRKQQGFSFGYFIREDKIVLSPRPTSQLRMKLSYVRKLPSLGIRSAKATLGYYISSTVQSIQLDTSSYIAGIASSSDYICLVDSVGNILVESLYITSENAPFSFTGTTSGFVLTVTAVTGTPFAVGVAIGGIFGFIESFGSGTGGTGTYNLTSSTSVPVPQVFTTQPCMITNNLTSAQAADINIAAVGNVLAFVVSGKWASTHSQLPDECEKYLITALERMIQYRQSSPDIQNSNIFTSEELSAIKEVFADNSYDDAKPPVTEWQEWLP